jgi:hypothetical protein
MMSFTTLETTINGTPNQCHSSNQETWHTDAASSLTGCLEDRCCLCQIMLQEPSQFYMLSALHTVNDVIEALLDMLLVPANKKGTCNVHTILLEPAQNLPAWQSTLLGEHYIARLRQQDNSEPTNDPKNMCCSAASEFELFNPHCAALAWQQAALKKSCIHGITVSTAQPARDAAHAQLA